MRPIDADALYESLDLWPDEPVMGYFVIHAIEGAPTLDYAPVIHSLWVLHEMNPKRVTVDGYVVCPECKHHFDRIKGTWFKRCPECGATMDGGQSNVP